MSYVYSNLELKLRAACEEGFLIGRRGNSATAATGEKFTVLINPEMKLIDGEQELYSAALDTFRQYAAGKTGTIYWRIYPEIETPRFYMRVLVSNKPALASLEEMR